MFCLETIHYLNNMAMAEYRRKRRKALRNLLAAQAANDNQ